MTESRIDALSLSVLAKGQPHQGRIIYLSTDGKGAIPTEALKSVVDRGGRVAAAFDADADGRKLTEKVVAAVANADRLTPTQGKDWNEQLVSFRQDLRDWYRQARDIGRSETHLSRIEQVGKAFTQDGTPLGERDLRMKAQDQEAWQQQVQTVANCAQTIPDHAGEPQAGGTLFEGKKYVFFARDDLLYAFAEQRGIPLGEDDRALPPNPIQQPDQGIMLKMIGGEVSTHATRVTKVDAQRFEQFAELLSNRLREQQYDR